MGGDNMDSEKLITVMEKLLKLHRSLLDLSERKTAVVTKGDMDALNKLLKDEQAHVAAISKLDNDRQKMASELVPGTDKPTINDCIGVFVCEQKGKLEELRSELTDTINMIQEKNELNQQLVYQSLQFV